MDHAPPSPPTRSTFAWNSIEAGSQATCGFKKCYVESAAKNGTGYLISIDADSGHGPLSWPWLYASCLTKRYGFKHFLLGPQESVKVSMPLASRLKSLHGSKYVYDNPGKRGALGELQSSPSAVRVQPVRTAPRGLLVGCLMRKWNHKQTRLRSFMGAMNSTTLARLRSSLESTRRHLQSEPCLLRDFQVFMSDGGDIFHIDVDRSWKCPHAGQPLTPRCLQKLVNMTSPGLSIEE